jgi:hypothetical protein
MTPRSRLAPASGSLARGAAAAATALLALSVTSCIERGYPLGSGGSVDVRLDVASPLFAADLLQGGKGAEPRQVPYTTGVTLTLTEGNEPANGGYVDVRVQPAEALALTPDDKESPDAHTCEAKDGKFRCTATPEGIARFVLTSEANWSGEATLVVTWSDQRKDTTVDVLPAGLPVTAKNFELIANGLTNTAHVLPTYTALGCTSIDSLPSDLGSKWRPGSIRSRDAFVRASPPPDQPGIVANAPVIVEALTSEVALSLDAACSAQARVSRLRLLLGPTGESPTFHFCFSDIGGESEIAVSSGLLAISPNPRFDVDPEPRVLRVSTLSPTVAEGASGVLYEVAAFNTDLQRIAMPVDLESSDPGVIQLLLASVTLAPEGFDPTGIFVTAPKTGTATLHVRPRLFKQPDCTSIEVKVTDAPPF